MMNWMKNWFAAAESTEADADRIKAAAKGLADDFEELRARFRERFLLESKPAAPALVHARNGKKK